MSTKTKTIYPTFLKQIMLYWHLDVLNEDKNPISEKACILPKNNRKSTSENIGNWE
jgi:hypothetical protein